MSHDNLPDNRAIVDRADSLMHRRRTSPPPTANPPSLNKQQEEEDFPVLTDIVPSLPTASLLPPSLRLDTLAEQLTQDIQEKLAAEIPVLVEAALNNALTEITQTLRSGLEETIQDGVRDFLKKTRE